MNFRKMRKSFVLTLLPICAPVMADQALVTLSCVDKTDPKYEMIIVFDPAKRKLIVPTDVTEVVINENTINFTEELKERFETTIYRSTGRYTVWARDPKTKAVIFTFGGMCSQKTKNQF
jgi:hypothetical protein